MRKFLAFIFALYSSEPLCDEKYLRYIGFDVGQILTTYYDTQEYVAGGPNTSFVCHKTDDEKKAPPTCYKIHLKSKHEAGFLNFYTGYRMGDYAAFEFGSYTTHRFHSTRHQLKGQTKINALHMGFVFMLPVTPRFEFLPGIGITHAFVHVYKPRVLDVRENGLIPRLVFGAQYKLNDKFKLRGSIVWHRVSGVYSDNMTMNSLLNVGIGLNYSFQPR